MGDHFRVILAVLAALEGLLERLGLVLGRLEGILDGLGGIFGASWRSGKRLGNVLGAILASLGAILGVSGASWTRKNIQKGETKPCQEAFPSRPQVWNDVSLILDRFFGPRGNNLIGKIPEGFSLLLTRN